MSKKLVLIGCGGTAAMIADYFERDENYELSFFSVHKKYLVPEFFGKKVVPLEEIEDILPVTDYYFFIAIGENDLNHIRYDLYSIMLSKGYKPASYISPLANISKHASLGNHCFILENVVIQYGCVLGDNVFILPNSYVAHHAHVGNHTFFSASTNLSGFSRIGDFSFIGSNSSVSNCVTVGENCLIGIGCNCTRDLSDNEALIAPHCIQKGNARKLFNIWHDKVAKIANERLSK